MAAGLVSHNITTSSGVTFGVISWVPDTGSPDIGAVPVARLTDGTNVAPVSATLGLKVDGSGVTQPVSGTVTVNTLPAGNNNIGDVDIATLPSLPSGANTIGGVNVISLPVQFGAGAATGTTQRVSIDTGQVGSLVAGAVPVVSGGYYYIPVSASQTGTVLQVSAGTTGDYLESILCIVTTAATSKVMIGDGAAPAVVVFPDNVGAGVGSYPVPLGYTSRTGSWRVTTGAGVSVIAAGKFA